MATTEARSQLPFYFSSAGAADEARIQHTGVNFEIDNDTGKTFFGDKTNTNLAIDHTLARVGIGTESPSYQLEIYLAATNVTMATNRADGATVKMSSRQTVGHIGCTTNHDLEVKTNNVTVATFTAGGDASIPNAYTTVIGGTNTDLYIDNTGLLGPNPSSMRYKENIRPALNANWIYNIPVKIADYINGPKDVITIIAEEAESVAPEIVRYSIYEDLPEGPKKINRNNYENILEADKIALNTAGNFMFLKKMDEGEPKEVEKNIIKLTESVNRSDLIIPMLLELQNLKKEIDALKTDLLKKRP